MGAKKTSVIKKIILNKATFNAEPVDGLSFVNFFYGNNGTGKSTIARAIKSGIGIEWSEGYSASDFDVAVYNQDFVNDNFAEYGNLKGVFTVNEVNIEIQKQIDERMAERARLSDEFNRAKLELQSKKELLDKLLVAFQDEIFKKVAKERADFDQALTGKKQKKSFAEAMLSERNPQEYDLQALKRLYDTAFDDSTVEYPTFEKIGAASTYGSLPGFELLGQSISSRSETEFARFIKALNMSDWVRNGHEHYANNSDGKCPFCQQQLPENYAAEIAACFDEEYQQDLNKLAQLQQTYISETRGIFTKLKNNLSNVMPGVDIGKYQTKLDLLEKSIEINIQRLKEKVAEPTKVISLEDTDSLLLEIGSMIDDINKVIQANNDVVRGRKASKVKCKTEILQHLAYILQGEIKGYLSEKTSVEGAIKAQEEKVKKLRADAMAVHDEITRLNAQTGHTSESMNAINRILVESGFQGFHLRAKEGMEHTYEVIRENGVVATDLSEGERNFIAFLYFHQQVSGSMDKDGTKPKIVVIDDPVSSMDSTALFFISGIVRTMISICRNNADYRNQQLPTDYIKQIFILTHNVYFHKEITYQQVGYHDCASFYMIRKRSNRSTVKLCVRDSTIPTEKENYNPVQNSYAALWEELRDVQSTTSAKNVMRRILEYYFLQLCGYEGEDLCERILGTEENKNKFIVPVENGNPDTTNYELALTMQTYKKAAHSIGDGISYTEESDDVDAYKNVFRLIFEALGQIQHYNMMIGKQKES